MSFNTRKSLGDTFEDEIFEYLQSLPGTLKVERTSVERTAYNLDDLKKRTDAEANFIRNIPDFLVTQIDGSQFYAEAKYGKTIHREAYETYLSIFRASGLDVALYFKTDDGIHHVTVRGLRFKDSQAIVNAQPEHKRFPIVDDWICPNTNVWNGSGLPYRYVDRRGMMPVRLVATRLAA